MKDYCYGVAADDIYLPRPIASLLPYYEQIVDCAASSVRQGDADDVESATALALYTAMQADPDLLGVRAYLDGALDAEYPGRSGKDFWAQLVATVFVRAHGGRPPATVDRVPFGRMFVPITSVIAAAHPSTFITPPAPLPVEHPNVLMYSGDAPTAIHLTKDAAKGAGYRTSGDGRTFVVVLKSYAHQLTPKNRIVVRFLPMTFADSVNTEGTALMLYGVNLPLLLGVRQAFLGLACAEQI